MHIRAIIPILCSVVWLMFAPQVSAIYIPDPEEIYQAFTDGFIDYTDYIALLEISRGWHITGDDSLYFLYFPNLLTGITANPHLIFREEPSAAASPPADPKVPLWRPSLLYRQYQRLTESNEQRRLYRAEVSYLNITVCF